MKRFVKDLVLITLGTALAALAMSIFLVPVKVVPGGVSGLSIIIHYLADLPVGAVSLAINGVLFLFAFRQMGKGFGLKSLYSTILYSVFLDFIPVPVLSTDMFLCCIYGGVLMGAGIGMVFLGGASTGGSDLVAKMLSNRFRRISISRILFLLDFVVVILAGIVFDPEMALYALAAVFISAKVIDFFTEGINYATAAYIISQKPEAIAQRLMGELERGVTALQGKGMYKQEDKQVLFCVVEGHRQVMQLKRIVQDEDKRAFMILTNAREAMGEGFKELN